MDKICVLGLGYIGLPTSAIFAKSGFDVLGVDIDTTVVGMINSGQVHIEETGLQELVNQVVGIGKLRADTQPTYSDAFIIAVPTPHNIDHSANLSYVVKATKSILPYLKKGNLVIIESTIPPRTIDDVIAPLLKDAGWNIGSDLYLAHCPERVLPGKILKELVENNRIVGGINADSTLKAANLYKSFVKGEVIETSAVSAEMSKLMENTFRDVNIALANELVKISEKLSVSALDVIKLANHHPRVNIHLPGPGVGGHCLAVDPYFIIEKAPNQSLLISEARSINNSMPCFVVEQISKKIAPQTGSKIAVLGLTYKGNVDDVRESPAITVVELLLERGYKVSVHDPHVIQQNVEFELHSFEEAISNASCILVLTDHDEFKLLDEESIINNTLNPVVFDTRNCVSIRSKDINYYNYNNLHEIKSLITTM